MWELISTKFKSFECDVFEAMCHCYCLRRKVEKGRSCGIHWLDFVCIQQSVVKPVVEWPKSFSLAWILIFFPFWIILWRFCKRFSLQTNIQITRYKFAVLKASHITLRLCSISFRALLIITGYVSSIFYDFF